MSHDWETSKKTRQLPKPRFFVDAFLKKRRRIADWGEEPRRPKSTYELLGQLQLPGAIRLNPKYP